MKSLADFKRSMRVGTMWHAFNHLYNTDMGIRECTIKQTNAFAFAHIKQDGSSANSWCDYPRASDIEFKADGSVLIYGKWRDDERVLKMTYKAVA